MRSLQLRAAAVIIDVSPRRRSALKYMLTGTEYDGFKNLLSRAEVERNM